ncbi:MAG: LacI family DNA-binding transcriptional regulator [Gaiellales bacterium]
MRDVAEHAGVSAQTVSNLVNNRLRQMSDETRLRIEGAMEQLGYHPNLTARSLRSSRTTTIGFLLLDEGARYLADPMTDQVIAGVGDVARDRGYSVLIHAGRPGPPDSGLLRPVLESRVDGVLLFLSGPPEQRAWYPARAAELHVPTVVLEEAASGDRRQLSVTADNRSGARMLADHLIASGHTGIAFIAARQPWPMVEQRHRGYCDALAAAGLERDPSLELFEGIWDPADGGVMVDRLLDLPQPPTAIMGGNDLLAIGVMQRARARGLRVPDDLAVTGFNDFAFAEFVEPPLTTVHVPGYEIGRTAAQLLIEHLDGEPVDQLQVTLPVELRLRESA